MTTAVMGSFRSRVEKAQQEVRTIEQKLEEAQDEVNWLYAAKAATEEVRALEAEIAQLFRAVKAAKADVAEAKQALHLEQLGHAEKISTQYVDAMWKHTHALHLSQLDLIALVRTMQDLGFESREIVHLFPRYLLFAEISSSFDGEGMKRDGKRWPTMGDRRASNDMISGQMAALRAELEAL